VGHGVALSLSPKNSERARDESAAREELAAAFVEHHFPSIRLAAKPKLAVNQRAV
jgi:hypothetical protein